MPDLTSLEIIRADEMRRNGHTYRSIASRLRRPVSTIHRSIQRYRSSNSLVRRRGQGRKRCTSRRDEGFLQLEVRRNTRLTAVQARNELEDVRRVRVSERTVRRRFEEVGLGSYIPAKSPKLERRHRVNRLSYAREHRHWDLNEWQQVIFTDECRVLLKQIDGRQRIWRRKRERHIQSNFEHTVAYGGDSIMVWRGICLGARMELVIVTGGTMTADRYIRDILEEYVVPFAPFIGDDFILMQDNARAHSAQSAQAYLSHVGIPVMQWPANSPDMNPIEHVWDLLKRRVKSRMPPPNNLNELGNALLEEWERLPQEIIDNIICSMPRRMETVIRARGGNTRY
ncbi:unnamed protein product [Parnassius mnemosyne]|uniref:Transposase n=1 Tax=Parnassius mnemosyne TaxID=213953 RepID=A0AAV1M0B2_9NEOP